MLPIADDIFWYNKHELSLFLFVDLECIYNNPTSGKKPHPLELNKRNIT